MAVAKKKKKTVFKRRFAETFQPITFTCDPDLLDAVTAQADKEAASMSATIRRLLGLALEALASEGGAK